MTGGPALSAAGRARAADAHRAEEWAVHVSVKARGSVSPSAAWERRLTRGAQLAGGAACWAEARTCAGEAVLFVGCGPLSENGPRGKRLGWFVCWAARRERKGAGLGFLGFFSILFPLSYLFLNQTKFEFKYKFEFKPHSNN